MNVLIIKLGATGDVVRTTPLIRAFKEANVCVVTAAKNKILLDKVTDNIQAFAWEDRRLAVASQYELVINLEDNPDCSAFLRKVRFRQLFGAYLDCDDKLRYTDDSKDWFDLSIISSYGKLKADNLKFRNRRTYQELIFEGLGLHFSEEPYLLPTPAETDLSGDVALATEAGPVWPMKKWAFYDELKKRLQGEDLTVNILPKRSSLLEHLSDVQNHRCLVSGDTLPMHFALGSGVSCVSLFTCTSPWEIYGYGLQKKIVSPLLDEFFYKRGIDGRATTAITVDEVFNAVMAQLETSTLVAR